MRSAGTVRAAAQLVASGLPWVPTREASQSADVTESWLTDKLGKRTPGAAAFSATDAGGTAGTTDRRRMVVEWNDAGTQAGLPKNIFIKSTPLTAKNRFM